MEDLPIIPVVYLSRMLDIMARENIGAAHILRECGIGTSLLGTADGYISLRQFKALIARFSGLSSQAFPGLRYGLELDSVTHGLIGYLVINQGHCRDLLTAIVDYLKVRLPIAELSVRHEDNYFSIIIRCHPNLQDVEPFVVQTLMGSLYTQGSLLTRNISVHFTKSALPDSRSMRSLLPAELQADSSCNEIRFHASEIADYAPEHDHPEAARHCTQPLEETGIILSLRSYLLARAAESPTIEEAAQHVGVSVRTLRRRLESSHRNFTQIRLDVRMQLAVRYLKTSDISIERISTLVGYSDQASFTRAFREWHGQTPLSLRQPAPERKASPLRAAEDRQPRPMESVAIHAGP